MKNWFSEEIGEEKAAVMLERRRLLKELNYRVGDGAAVYRVGENHQMIAIERKFNRLFEDLGGRHAFSRELEYIEAAAVLGKQFKTDKAGLVSENMVSLSIELIRKKIGEIMANGSVDRFLLVDSIVSGEIESSIRSQIVGVLIEMFEKFPGAVNNMEPETVLAVAYAYEKSFREYADWAMWKVWNKFFNVKRKFLENADTELLPISRESIEKTLGEVVITGSEFFHRYFYRVSGQYKSHTAEICVNLDSSEEYMETVIMHELLHALSGKTFLVDGQGRSGDIDRLGFRHVEIDPESNSKLVCFNWMNEGFTESLCQEFAGRDFNAYLPERALVEKLFEGMPDKGILNRAYFEDYDESKTGTGEARGYWEQVLAYLAERFGRCFLIDLDDYIYYQGMKQNDLSKGAEMAALEWGEMGDKFPAHVSSFMSSLGENLNEVENCEEV